MNERRVTKVADVMDENFVFVHGLTTVAEALTVMREKKTTHLMVDRRHKDDEYGIVLISDIAKHVLAEDRSPERVNVYEIMSKPVLFIRPGMDIRYCARFFDRFAISTAPVISRGEVRGIVTYANLVLKGLIDSP